MESKSAERISQLEQVYRTTLVVVGAQVASVFILTAAAFFVVDESRAYVSSNTVMTIWIGILFLALGTFILRRLLFRWERLKDIALLRGYEGVVKTLQSNSILLAALAESVAVLGFVVAVISGYKWEMFRAGLIALIVFAVNFPRKNVWKRITASLNDVLEV